MTQLTTGMFIQAFEGSWLSHPFWRTKFLVSDRETLQRIRDSGLEECWIDSERGEDVVPGAALEVQEAGAPPAAEDADAVPGSTGAVPLAEELERAAVLRSRSAIAMRSLLEEARLGNAIEPGVCAPIVGEVVDSINRNPDALLSLLRLKSADEYTYLHSVAVCALMVALGRQLGFDDAQCHDAGMAGMLHDLGKAAMPLDILNKPGKLTDEEFAIIRQHPVRGHEMLLEAGGASEGVLDVCRHHHERMDGSGYPDQLAPEQISLLARMGAVCDVYDAVTSDRPYKAGWDPAHAIAQMASWQGHFDPTVFQAFVRSIGIYPVGSLVRMRTGRLAVVLEQNPAALTRPKVKLFYSINAGLPIKPAVLDLAAPHCNDRIEARESPDNWRFTHLQELWAGGSMPGRSSGT